MPPRCHATRSDRRRQAVCAVCSWKAGQLHKHFGVGVTAWQIGVPMLTSALPRSAGSRRACRPSSSFRSAVDQPRALPRAIRRRQASLAPHLDAGCLRREKTGWCAGLETRRRGRGRPRRSRRANMNIDAGDASKNRDCPRAYQGTPPGCGSSAPQHPALPQPTTAARNGSSKGHPTKHRDRGDQPEADHDRFLPT